MTALIHRMVALLLLFAGPDGTGSFRLNCNWMARLADQPQRDAICPVDRSNVQAPLEDLVTAGSGFDRKQRLRGVCLILDIRDGSTAGLPAPERSSTRGGVPAGLLSGSSLSARPAGWQRQAAASPVALATVSGVQKAGRSVAGLMTGFEARLSGACGWLVETAAVLEKWTVGLATPRAAFEPEALSAGCPSANGYWDYYGDCDKWGVGFQKLPSAGGAAVSRSGAAAKGSAGAEAGQGVRGLTDRYLRGLASRVVGLQELGAAGGRKLTGFSDALWQLAKDGLEYLCQITGSRRFCPAWRF